MWNNIGGKIKALAKVVFWITAVLMVISAISCIVVGIDQNNHSYRGDSGTILIVTGVLLLILGPFFAWIGSFLLCGFGQLVESSEQTAYFTRQIVDQNNTLLRMNDATAAAVTQMARGVQTPRQADYAPPAPKQTAEEPARPADDAAAQ